MKLPRRRFLYAAGGAVALPTLLPIAEAQTYPSRPVHLIEGFGAGGTPDILARLLSQWLAERLGQPFVVENRSGATGRIAAEATGVDMIHIPYRGTQVYPDLLGGQGQVFFGPLPSSIGYIKAGKLRALAVTTATRSAVLPVVPTAGASVPGYEASIWFGVGAPRATPAEIVERLNREINAALADPTMKAKLAEQDDELLPGSPADFGKLIAEETEIWGKVIQAANIRPD
jgi:tripartite-type tricarboxylate transporter receptor subunit TctC